MDDLGCLALFTLFTLLALFAIGDCVGDAVTSWRDVEMARARPRCVFPLGVVPSAAELISAGCVDSDGGVP